MSIKKSHKLLPCPFCGSSDVVIDQTTSEDDVYNRKNGCMSSRYYAYCFGCFAESNKFRTSIGAIKAWNKRTSPPRSAPNGLDNNSAEKIH